MNFDELYKNNPNLYGNEPSDWIVKILEYQKNPAKILDLGICYGRNAIFLAKHGFEVVGVDISKIAIQQCIEDAQKNNLKIACRCQDIKDYVFENEFDIVYSTMSLQYLGKEKVIKEVIEKMKMHTKIGGLNVISVPTNTKIAMDMPYYFNKEDLLLYYKNWEILEFDEQEDVFTSGKIGTIAFIIARKK